MFLQETLVGLEAMHPFRWWQGCLRAAMHSGIFSFKRGDTIDMAGDLTFCLTMLAILPKGVWCKRLGDVQAVTREVEWTAKPPAGPRFFHAPVVVNACSKPSPELRQPAQDAYAHQSVPAKVNMQCSS
jgi:hypothetical protein